MKNSKLSQRDFAKLKEGVWLNDEVINEYIELIRIRGKERVNKHPDTLVFNTFMYSLISNDLANGCYSYEKYKRNWERRLKVNISAMDQIIFPINKHNSHWLLCRVNLNCENVQLEIYDSLPSGDTSFVEEVAHTISVLLNDAFTEHTKEDVSRLFNLCSGKIGIMK